MPARKNRTDDPSIEFLKRFRVHGNVSQACREIEWGRRTAYDLRERDLDFAAAWEDAELEAADGLRQEARRRAVEGWYEPVFYQGSMCGQIIRYSNSLLALLLKAHCLEFKDEGPTEHTLRLKGDAKDPVELNVNDKVQQALSAEDRAVLREMYQRALVKVREEENG